MLWQQKNQHIALKLQLTAIHLPTSSACSAFSWAEQTIQIRAWLNSPSTSIMAVSRRRTVCLQIVYRFHRASRLEYLPLIGRLCWSLQWLPASSLVELIDLIEKAKYRHTRFSFCQNASKLRGSRADYYVFEVSFIESLFVLDHRPTVILILVCIT